MRVIAHRGCLAQYPENTLRAFRESAPAVDMIETDVRRCGSGELVVFHDETLDRLTDLDGAVADTPYADLRSASVLGSGEGVPLLDAVFEAVPADVGLNLELKDTDVAADVQSMAAPHDHEVLVSSFDATELAAAHEAGCDRLAYLFGEDVPAGLATADELGCEAVHPHVDCCLESDVVALAHDRGFTVNTWTVQTVDELTGVRAAGVDGVVVDDYRLPSST